MNDKDKIKEIGDRIRKLRNFKGMSQKDVAEKIGVHSNEISRWERGDRLASFLKLLQLSKIFEVSVEHFNTERSVKLKVEYV